MPRAGWNEELRKRAWAEPSAARPIAELVKRGAVDVRERQDEWETADDLTGFTAREDGSLVVAFGTYDAATHESHDSISTNIFGIPSRDLIALTKGDISFGPTTLNNVELYLDPAAGGVQEVEYWELQVLALTAVWVYDRPLGPLVVATKYFELAPLSDPVRVDAVGTAGWVDFDFTHMLRPPMLGAIQPELHNPEDIPPERLVELPPPMSFLALNARKGDGDAAAFAGFAYDSTQDKITDGVGTTEVYRKSFSKQDFSAAQRVLLPGMYRPSDNDWSVGEGAPRIRLKSRAMPTDIERTISFTGAGNHLDLGAAPAPDTELVCVARGDVPVDAKPGVGQVGFTFEISDDNGASWHPFTDGDRIGEDNAERGGKDLSAVARQQNYDVRVAFKTATQSFDLASLNMSEYWPILRAVGVEELTVRDLDGLVDEPEVTWALDPITCKAETTSLRLPVLRDGAGPPDYADLISEMLATTDLSDLEVRLWYGHPDLPRANWLHLDDFILEDHEDGDVNVGLSGLNQLVRLRRKIPKYAVAGEVREPMKFDEGTTLRQVWDEVFQNQLGLAERYQGQPPPSTLATPLLRRTIDELDHAKVFLDEVTFAAGGCVIGSQGRVRYVDVYANEAVFEAVPLEETETRAATPGHAQRSPEAFFRFDWDPEEEEFTGEVHASNLDAVNAVGVETLEEPVNIPEGAGRWVYRDEDAKTIAVRHVESFGSGYVLLRQRFGRPRPYLELGDRIVTRTDRLVTRDPETGAEIRGVLWVVATVVTIHGADGREFTLWVRRLDDIYATAGDAPVARAVEIELDTDGVPTVSWTPNDLMAGARITYDVHDPLVAPTLGNAVDVDASLGTLELAAVVVPPEDRITVQVEPWSGFSGGAVSGIAGEPKQAAVDFTGVPAALVTLDTYVDGAFHDQVITEAEAKAIARHIAALNAEKDNVDAQYDALVLNLLLSGPELTDLETAKGFYDAAHTDLINEINTAIADGETTQAEANAVDAEFASYGVALGNFFEAVQAAIDSIKEARSGRDISIALSEPEANVLRVDVTDIDPGAQGWQLYARLGAWPTSDGTAGGPLLAQYAIDLHIPHGEGSITMPAASGTWHVVALAVDRSGTTGDRATATLAIAGTADVGALSNLRIVAVDDVSDYHEIRWDHDAEIESPSVGGPYTLRISERLGKGLYSIIDTGVDPKAEASGGTTANYGDYHAPTTLGVKGSDPLLTYRAKVELLDNGVVKQTLTAEHTDYYDDTAV